MGKTACLLNSPELGGAERSFLIQLGLFNDRRRFDIYVPQVGDHKTSSQLTSFIEENKLSKSISFKYDSSLYEVSRSSFLGLNLVSLFVGLMEQILEFKQLKIFEKNQIWCNGNKVFLPAFLGAILFGYQGTIIWHWRDYPGAGKLSQVINFLGKKMSRFNLVLAGNSKSVCTALSNAYSDFDVVRLYNPVSLVKPREQSKEYLGVIGFAGMSAPWKGLHELYFWSSLYENELREAGVKEIALYGKNIYLTKGEHTFYQDELKRLKQLFPNNIIKEKGLVSPDVIYDSIDLMLHLSNKEEPFGRVILESFAHGVPCISTGLGGAGELMNGLDHLKHFSYDYGGLTEKVKSLFLNRSEYEAAAKIGLIQFKYFQKKAESDLEALENTYFQ